MDIKIVDLVKDYGKFRALDHISLQMGSGMFGLLGPNGAGKTTLMRIITTLLPITTGRVTVGGVDVMRDPTSRRTSASTKVSTPTNYWTILAR
jgi:ABC-2 type transport system ATP-binding protein